MRNSKFKIQNSKFFKFLLVYGFISTFSSCTNESVINSEKTTKENSLTSRPVNPDPIVEIWETVVYGVYTETQNVQPFNQTAKLRIGDNVTTLSTLNSGANCVSVSNNLDVYVGGFENTTPYSVQGAKIWKNGLNYFSLPVGSSAVTSIVTNYEDVYFITGKDIYKNNALLYTLSTTGSAYAGYQCKGISIYVYGADLYACGTLSCNAVAVWKNGILTNAFPQTTTNADYLSGSSIYVDNTGVYVAGKLDGQAKVWKNGNQINLPTISGSTSHADGITGDGTDVYIAGCINIGGNGGRLWKMNKANNVVSVQGNYYGARTSVFNYLGEIYTGGWEKIWKNTELLLYTDTGIYYNSIFVRNI